MLNALFVTFIIVSFAAYFYYKTKQFRTSLPIQKKWYKAKAGVALGLFVVFFGLNTFIVQDTLLGNIVGVVFVVVGLMESYHSYKRAKHEGKFVQQEYELNKQ
jgi:amino acid transporter